ncbi:class I SAM-dependent methyltransferase [Nocardia sp. XZ_19_385]|uniref:class I SAM-dependent methyltransferase n=1 Tax=Nocardia sp. XZ_19_385 TaxID=2769488 RepID=UPI0028153F75|nr:class I SAM-dependent methyltransferase [Nocardia sp. XZ_19_385]
MGTQDSYDEIAEDYAARFGAELREKPLDRALLRVFADEVGEEAVADIGCGPGHVSWYLEHLGARVVGFDLSPRMVELAGKTYEGIEFQVGDMRKLDVAEGVWGGIVAFYSIIHVPLSDLPGVFQEFHRALLPGGQLLLSFHVGSEVLHLDDMLGHTVDLDFHFFERPQIEALLTEAGFRIDANLERRAYPTEVDTTRAYLLARKQG